MRHVEKNCCEFFSINNSVFESYETDSYNEEPDEIYRTDKINTVCIITYNGRRDKRSFPYNEFGDYFFNQIL